MAASASDSVFLQEQRKFRRLEVELSVWITVEEALSASPDEVPWEVGTTRDISMGGSKVLVPTMEEAQWREAMKENLRFALRVGSDAGPDQTISGFVRHVARDIDSGRLALGIQFDESKARDARSAAVQSGLKTIKARRRWQGAFAVAVCVLAVSMFAIRGLRAEVARKNAQIAQLSQQKLQAQQQFNRLSRPGMVASRAQGIQNSLQREQVQQTIAQLTANIERLNNPKFQQQAIKEVEAERKRRGMTITPASTAARAQLAIAFPYGYNWPLVLDDLEVILGRKVPHVVVFHDWKQNFPDLDAREARDRGKVLQVTWEPWHFSNPGAIKLKDIVAGKHDRYIDAWAAGARSFGSEIWVRWGHEFNGNWYPWSLAANGTNATLWIQAYKHIRQRFRMANASNVRWIWCINAENVPAVGWNNPMRAYPGDDWVDVIGIDGYNFGNSIPYGRWLSFKQIFAAPYAAVVAKAPNKPIWIAETGCSMAGGDKASWIKGMDQALRQEFPRVESVTWFEAEKEADWRMISSPGSLMASKKVWSAPYFKRGAN